MEWDKIGAALAAIVVGAGAIVRKTMRNRSADKVEAAKNEAETRIISRLEQERDDAQREAAAVRELHLSDSRRIARLEAENRWLKSYAQRVMRALPDKERAFFETDFAAFDDRPTPPPQA